MNELTLTRTIAAPRSAIWAAWSDPRILETWWCPKPWTTRLGAYAFESGGPFESTMCGPDGEEMSAPGVFLDVTPMERIVFTSALGNDWRPITLPDVPITACYTLSGAPEGTRYEVRVLHRDADDCRKHEDMGFYPGWNAVIDQLDAVAKDLA